MKKLFIIFILFSNFNKVIALDTLQIHSNRKIIVSIYGGYAIPTGSIAEYERNHYPPSLTGSAANGYYGKVEFEYLFSKYFGATVMFSSSSNKANNLSDASLNNISPLPIPFDYGYVNGYSYLTTSNYTSNFWKTNSFLVGLSATKSIRFIDLNFKISGGIQQVICPSTKFLQKYTTVDVGYYDPEFYPYYYGYYYTYYHYSNDFRQQEMFSSNFFAVDAALNIKFNLSKKIGISIGMDEFCSKPTFKGKQTIISGYDYGTGIMQYTQTQQNISFTKNVYLTCINVGISYVIK